MEMKKIDFNNMDEKTKGYIKIGIIIIGLFIGLLLFMAIVKIFVGNVVSFDKIENIMVRAADQYMTKHEDKFDMNKPYEIIELNTSDLVIEGYMKDFSKYTAKDVMCNGKVLVVRNDENVSYIPKLDCGEAYKYKELVTEITDEKNIVTEQYGLYKIDGENPYYLYKGEYPNNYVKYAGKTWRIMRINESGDIRLIYNEKLENSSWDNRYNSEKKTTSGINNFEDVQPSRIKDYLLSKYNDEEFLSKENKSLIIPQEICIGKRSENEFDFTGNIECSQKSELMGMGLIYLSEYFQVSLDVNCLGVNSKACSNYNYLTIYDKPYWTVTASSENTYQAYYIDSKAQIANTSRTIYVRPVIIINGKINYKSGTGTQDDPYVIEANVTK